MSFSNIPGYHQSGIPWDGRTFNESEVRELLIQEGKAYTSTNHRKMLESFATNLQKLQEQRTPGNASPAELKQIQEQLENTLKEIARVKVIEDRDEEIILEEFAKVMGYPIAEFVESAKQFEHGKGSVEFQQAMKEFHVAKEIAEGIVAGKKKDTTGMVGNEKKHQQELDDKGTISPFFSPDLHITPGSEPTSKRNMKDLIPPGTHHHPGEEEELDFARLLRDEQLKERSNDSIGNAIKASLFPPAEVKAMDANTGPGGFVNFNPNQPNQAGLDYVSETVTQKEWEDFKAAHPEAITLEDKAKLVVAQASGIYRPDGGELTVASALAHVEMLDEK